ncbi:hypothetical protein F5141DRAFT_1216679 [Pisolithus sp. B1]|nr:hypothetical protein F5141DRAFT_1216679 [Pisolithus sp. B1]
MAPIDTRIFLTGATGYLGGSVLSRLIEHPTYEHTEIWVLIRPSKEGKIPAFRSLGVKTVLGTYDDLDLLEDQAAHADIVFACADADNLPGAQAILKGMRKKHERTGVQPLLIHTSGTGEQGYPLYKVKGVPNEPSGVLIDDAKGLHSTDIIYDDMNPDQIHSLPPTQPHRNVDLAVLKADRDHDIKSYIILPSTVYSHAKTKLVALGVQNPRSIQIPMLIHAGLLKGQGGVVGNGENIWPNVHIDDVSDLFVVVYENALSGRAAHGREGFYFGENGEHKVYDVSKAIAQALYELGKGRSPEPEPFTQEDYEHFGRRNLEYLGTNSRCRGRRGRLLGWKPKYTTEDMFKGIKFEAEYVIQHEEA